MAKRPKKKRGQYSLGAARRVIWQWLQKTGHEDLGNFPQASVLASIIEAKAGRDHSKWPTRYRARWAAQWCDWLDGKGAQPRQPRSRKSEEAERWKRDTEQFLASAEWTVLRDRIFRKYGKVCMRCRATDRHVPITVDHIISRKRRPDLALDENNLQVLCRACNSSKGHEDETDYRPATAEAA